MTSLFWENRQDFGGRVPVEGNLVGLITIYLKVVRAILINVPVQLTSNAILLMGINFSANKDGHIVALKMFDIAIDHLAQFFFFFLGADLWDDEVAYRLAAERLPYVILEAPFAQ